MDVKWSCGEDKRTDWYDISEPEPTDDYGTLFSPHSVAITVTTYRDPESTEDDDGRQAPQWSALVVGRRLLADGSVGQRRYEARWWDGHSGTPAWLQSLADELLAKHTAQ